MSNFATSSTLPENAALFNLTTNNISKLNDPRNFPSTNAKKCVRDIRGVFFTLHLIKLENEHSDNIQVNLCALSQLSGSPESDFTWRYDYTFNMTDADTRVFDTLLETLNTDNFTMEYNNQSNQLIFTVLPSNTKYVLISSVNNTPFSFTDHFNVEKLKQENKRLKETLESFRQTFMNRPIAGGCSAR
jgi:hypothetical protein